MMNFRNKDSVKILTSQGSIDPNIYVVDFVSGTTVGITNQSTNVQTKVHSSRIHEVLGENAMDTDNTTTETTTVKPKAKRVRKAKTPPAPVDFDALVADGYEPWIKRGLSLGSDAKVASIQVAAVCLIDSQGRHEALTAPDSAHPVGTAGYEIFNLYDGTRGKKGKVGKFFPFTEKNTIEKKRKSLEKGGYSRIGGNLEVTDVIGDTVEFEEPAVITTDELVETNSDELVETTN
jgi:hypothetical protein